jgi:starch-binding outer membrane protein, SusD/RagB family
MKKVLLLILYCLAAFSLFGFISCKKLIEVAPPVDQLTTKTVFSNDSTAVAAVRGIYSDIMRLNNYIGNGGISLYCGLSADELATTRSISTYDAFLTNSLLPNNYTVGPYFWQKGYFHIYQANAVLENLGSSKGITGPARAQLTGETKFIRAFFYFYLTNLFGPVPLTTTADYRYNSTLTRSESSEVYKQIISDLKDAQSLLSDDYPTAEKIRPNKYAATALLARVYLYLKDWTDAEEQSNNVINSGKYQLTTLDRVFLPNNSEAILQWIPAATQGFNSSEGFAFIPASTSIVPTFIVTDSLLNQFDSNDERKTQWINKNTVGGKTYYYPYKYRTRLSSAGAPKSEYNLVLRLAEQYLIRAEARTHQNKITDALDDVAIIRNRARLAPLTASSEEVVLNYIQQENFKEFFAEWGHRWFDLKRLGTIDSVLSQVKNSNWQSSDALFPVPQSEIDTNPFLTQNPGY